ncbi:MAG: hypothetical protein LQ340_006957, partial [Diploschistes diacapsis]
MVLTGASDRTIRLFNPLKASVENAEPTQREGAGSTKGFSAGLVQSYSAHGYEVLDIAVTSDNARFASVGGDRQVFLWDVAQGKTLKRWTGHSGRINAVDFGGEGSVVVSEPINSVQQTRDGNALLVSTLDSTIRLFDKGNGQLLQSYTGHANKKYRIRSTLAQADAAVISGSEDGAIFIWDVLDGRVVEKLQAHGGNVVSAVSWNCALGRKEWASAGSD